MRREQAEGGEILARIFHDFGERCLSTVGYLVLATFISVQFLLSTPTSISESLPAIRVAINAAINGENQMYPDCSGPKL